MLKHLKNFLEPPVFPEEQEKTRTAKVLNALVLSFFLILGVNLLVTPFLFVQKLGSLFVLLGLFITLVLVRALMYRGKVRQGSLIFVIANWLIVSVFVFLSGGMTGVTTILYIAITVITGLLLGVKRIAVIAIISSLVGLSMALMDTNGISLPVVFPIPAIPGWFILTITLFMVSVTLSITLQSLQEALTATHQQLEERIKTEKALYDSTEKIRAMFESVTDGITITDLNGQILELNETAVRLLGYHKKEDLLGKNSMDLIQESAHSQARQGFQDVFQYGHSGIMEYKFITKDGREFDAELSVVLLKDKGDHPSGFVALIRDISERAQAQKLEDAVYRIAQAFNTAENLDILFSDIHAIICNVMSAENFYISLYDQDADLLSFPFCIDQIDQPPETKPPGKGLTEYVLRTGEPLLCDLTLYKELVKRGEIERIGTPAQIWLGVPLKVESQVIGVMAVQHHTNADVYGHREQRILEYVSTQVAEAIARKHIVDALLESEARYRGIVEDQTELIFRWLPDGTRTFVNESYCRLFSRSAEDLIGKSFFPEMDPDARKMVLTYIQGLTPTSDVITYEEQTRIPDIGFRWMMWTDRGIFDENGNLLEIQSIGRDITELKHAERALQTSEARYRGIIEDQTEFIVRWLPDGRRTFVNNSYCRFLGQPREELVGQSFLSLLVEEDQKMVMEKLQGLSLEQDIETYEERVLSADGEPRYLFWTDRGIFDKDGELQEIQSVGRDITERKLIQEQMQRQVERLAALRAIDSAIATSFDLRVTLDVLLKQVLTQLNVDAAAVLLLNQHTQMLSYYAQRGFNQPGSLKIAPISLGKGLAGQVILKREMVHIPDLHHDPNDIGKPHHPAENFVTYYGIPLIAKGQVKGVLETFHRAPLTTDRNWQDFFATMAGQAAIAIDNTELFENLERSNMDLTLAYNATLEGWAKALEIRDVETRGHSERVVDQTVKLAREFGFHDEHLAHVYRGALLHDIGKMGISDTILLKPGPLSDEEWEIMRQHPVYAYEMLSPIHFLRPALDIPYAHHEKWDGSGYPRGLNGEAIPLAARIFSVVDVWDALRSERPHRPSWSDEKALVYIQERQGVDFDPQVVDAFLKLIGQA